VPTVGVAGVRRYNTAVADATNVLSKENAMRVIVVKFQLKPEHVDQFLDVARIDSEGSVQNEPGCLRFDVIQDGTDPNIVCFYEVYKDDAAYKTHQKTPHYARFSEAMRQDWMAADIEAVRGWSVYPSDEDW
jgi:quinol monooxygenase YgiN